MGGALFHQYNN